MISNSNFEIIYDKYGPMLYGLASEICHSNQKAEELLISTFKKIRQEDIYHEKCSVYCMRLMIKTAQDLYPEIFKSYFRIKQFEKTPLINYLICNQISLQDYFEEKYLSEKEGLQIIRKEFSTIGNGRH